MEHKKILVLGATSSIAIETDKLFANAGADFYLAARNKDQLETIAQDLRTRGSSVYTHCIDLKDPSIHSALINSAHQKLGRIDIIFLAYGILPEQKECETDQQALLDAMNVNFLSPASILLESVPILESQKSGTIVAISSVAGDRGRKSNFIYGSAKAGLTTFLAGLRNKLSPSGVHVVTVLPGFVDTKMTEHLPKNKLFAKPAEIGNGIVNAVNKKKDVVYLPWFWIFIMMIIRNIPEKIFKKMNL